MRASLLQPQLFTAQPLFSFLNPHEFAHNRSFPFPTRHYLGWNNSRSTSSTRRSGINFEDELYAYGDDDFRFTGASKQRVWWSNDEINKWFDDDDDDDDDKEEEEDEFWIFKVFRAFGWMVPAIGISLLLRTGTNDFYTANNFFTALAVPLGQTALSLVIDKVWGSKSQRSKPRGRKRTRTRTRSRKKPFVRPRSREETSKRKDNTTREEEGGYESWMAAAGSSRKKNGKKVHPFGGWDE
ncbi:uncharacterized protein [Euphorbia lathyris]|uniref:uncharacterized protein n=1 Tax=Euphorbia lathyris TaxID=212925 RepID=UPI003313CA1B